MSVVADFALPAIKYLTFVQIAAWRLPAASEKSQLMERGWTLSCVFLCALWTASSAQMTFSPAAGQYVFCVMMAFLSSAGQYVFCVMMTFSFPTGQYVFYV